MTANEVAVFFYGLFMDESVLTSKGIRPGFSMTGFVDGFSLRIGDRATLVPDPAGRAYGVLMTIRSYDATVLYADESVADYEAEPVSVTLSSGAVEAAVCYNLRDADSQAINRPYAEALLQLACKMNFPEDYLAQIRAATKQA